MVNNIKIWDLKHTCGKNGDFGTKIQQRPMKLNMQFKSDINFIIHNSYLTYISAQIMYK